MDEVAASLSSLSGQRHVQTPTLSFLFFFSLPLVFTLSRPHPAVPLFSLPAIFPPSLCHPLFLSSRFSLPLRPLLPPHLRDCLSAQLDLPSFLSRVIASSLALTPPPPSIGTIERKQNKRKQWSGPLELGTGK